MLFNLSTSIALSSSSIGLTLSLKFYHQSQYALKIIKLNNHNFHKKKNQDESRTPTRFSRLAIMFWNMPESENSNICTVFFRSCQWFNKH